MGSACLPIDKFTFNHAFLVLPKLSFGTENVLRWKKIHYMFQEIEAFCRRSCLESVKMFSRFQITSNDNL